MAAHQAPPSLGFSRQEHWSGLPLPSLVHESEKWKRSCSVVSDSLWPHGLQPTRLLCPWDFPGKCTGVGCHCLLWSHMPYVQKKQNINNRSNILTNSLKTSKMVHTKKKKKNFLKKKQRKKMKESLENFSIFCTTIGCFPGEVMERVSDGFK